jgi:hypothetical protein
VQLVLAAVPSAQAQGPPWLLPAIHKVKLDLTSLLAPMFSSVDGVPFLDLDPSLMQVTALETRMILDAN